LITVSTVYMVLLHTHLCISADFPHWPADVISKVELHVLIKTN